MSGVLDKCVAETQAVINAVSIAYKECDIPFSWAWEAINKEAEKELNKESEAAE